MLKLYVLNGPERGRSFDLQNHTTLLGRSSDNHIQIKDNGVSRTHLRIHRNNGQFFIEDLSTSNGTLLNGEKISPGEKFEVGEGHPITVGKTLMVLGEALSAKDKSTLNFGNITAEIDANQFPTPAQDRPMTHFKNMELLYRVSMVLMGSLDVTEIFQKIMDHMFDLLKRIDRGAILLIDEETRKLKQIAARSDYSNEKAIPNYSRTVVNKVINEGKPVIMQDTTLEDENDLSDSMKKIRSVMCVPLISKFQIRGVIYVDSVDRPHGFRREDLYLLTSLSSSAAIAIENAALYSNLEQIVRKRTTTLQKTQEKLQESEARFKAIFSHMSSGVVVYKAVNNGKDFVVLDMNKADEKIEEIKKPQKLGKSVLQVSSEFKDVYLLLLETLKKVWKTGKPARRTVTISSEEKITASREYYVYPLPSGEIVAIYDDVTDRKKAEAEQKALQEQLFRSQKMESIGAFASGTAHNFRNILQAILGNIEYLEMIHADKSEVRELAKSVHDSVEKGVGLINNLLHFSKRDGEYELADLELADVIMETCEIIERLFDKNIEIVLNLGKNLFVKGNRALLGQVFMNLFTNARDAMPGGGRLLVEAKKSRDRVIAKVSDTGHGMDKEILEKIFDPFFTLKEVGKGSGLGLSTTHGIIEQHNGAISVKSQPGKGTTFTIQLQSIRAEKPQEEKPKKELIFGNGQKVLILDDERPALDALSNLTKSLGYEPISIEKPTEALKKYTKMSPDVVLLDRSMPEMDGSTFIMEITKIDPTARIIIISGYEESGPDGLEEGVRKLIMGYLTKPFNVEELSRALAQALENDKRSRKLTKKKRESNDKKE
jgi:signal transduction histidine kinase/pSer/pThr/pTyr-binding forkhead associated (FHA) protein/ActR/RegA family two-component response regulator